MSLSSYAIMFGSSKQKAQRVIEEIGQLKVGDVVTESNGYVTVTNRRMFRKWQAQESEKEAVKQRVSRHRDAQAALVSEDCNGSVTETELNGHKSLSSSSKRDIPKREGKQKKKRPVITRIPDPFPLTAEMRKWAVKECPGLLADSAHDRFVEYWTNNTTAKAEKVNWAMTWRNGMKLALKWQKENQAKSQLGKHDPAEIFVPDPPCEFCGRDDCLDAHKAERLARL